MDEHVAGQAQPMQRALVDPKYDNDDVPLSPEEIRALDQAETSATVPPPTTPAHGHGSGLARSAQPPSLSPSKTTPSGRGRGRARRSASPFETSTRLRPTIQRTPKYVAAGFPVTNSHALRQGRSLSMESGTAAVRPQSPSPAGPPSRPSLEVGSRSESADRESEAAAHSAGQQPPYHYTSGYPLHGPPGQMPAQGLVQPPPQQGMPQFHPQAMMPPYHPYPMAQPMQPHYHQYPVLQSNMPQQQMNPYSHPAGGGFRETPPYSGQAHPHDLHPPYGQPPGLTAPQYADPRVSGYPYAPRQNANVDVKDDRRSRTPMVQSGRPSPIPQVTTILESIPAVTPSTTQAVAQGETPNAGTETEIAATREVLPPVVHPVAPAKSATVPSTSLPAPIAPAAIPAAIPTNAAPSVPNEFASPITGPSTSLPAPIAPAAIPANAAPSVPNEFASPIPHDNRNPSPPVKGDSWEALDSESPTTGRISNAARKALRKGFHDLDELLKRISGETGLSVIQIVERWDVLKNRGVHAWNIYQAYFEERRDEELGQLPPEQHPPSGAPASKAVVSACYEAFKAAKGQRYDQLLKSWYRVRLLDGDTRMSYAKRSKEYKKLIQQLDELTRQASARHSFEVMYIAIGGVVNQDQNLADVGGSDAFMNFFLERFKLSNEQVVAHAKAHVYDRLSKRMVQEEDIDFSLQPPSPTRGQTVIKMESTAAATANPPDEHEVNINELKTKFKVFGAKYNVELISPKGVFSWKKLAHLFAAQGCVMYNYPEDVTFPPDTKAQKGISGLKRHEAIALLEAFDHPTHPLGFKKKYKHAVPDTEPGIIGIPPRFDSPHTHGRRKFLDKPLNEDRNGPARLPPPSSAAKAHVAKKATSRSRTPSANDGVSSKASKQKEAKSQFLPSDTQDSDEETLAQQRKKKGKAKASSKRKAASAASEASEEEDEIVAVKAKDQAGRGGAKKARFAEPVFKEPTESEDPSYASDDGECAYSGDDDGSVATPSPRRTRQRTSRNARNAKPSHASAKRPTVLDEDIEDESSTAEDTDSVRPRRPGRSATEQKPAVASTKRRREGGPLAGESADEDDRTPKRQRDAALGEDGTSADEAGGRDVTPKPRRGATPKGDGSSETAPQALTLHAAASPAASYDAPPQGTSFAPPQPGAPPPMWQGYPQQPWHPPPNSAPPPGQSGQQAPPPGAPPPPPQQQHWYPQPLHPAPQEGTTHPPPNSAPPPGQSGQSGQQAPPPGAPPLPPQQQWYPQQATTHPSANSAYPNPDRPLHPAPQQGAPHAPPNSAYPNGYWPPQPPYYNGYYGHYASNAPPHWVPGGQQNAGTSHDGGLAGRQASPAGEGGSGKA